MNRFRSFYVAAFAVTGIGLYGACFIPRAHADAWSKMSIVTVNEPIIAGNKVFAPGTYVWKLMDSQSNRHVVQIFDKDQRHLEETILAIPNSRLEPKGNSQFSFWETPAGVPKAVRAWFYPGDTFGQEFAYPSKLVAQMASAAPVPIPVSYREPEPPPTPQPVAEPAPAPETSPTPPPAEVPAPLPQPQVAAPQPQVAAPIAEQPTSLPHTASFNPLVGIAGLALVSLAGLLGLATRKSSR